MAISFTALLTVVGLLWLSGVHPKDQRPGLWLKGHLVEAEVIDWSFTDSVKEIYIQTNTRYFIPHSVTAYSATHNGNYYIMSAYYDGGSFPDARAWNRNIVRDPRVRLKIGDDVFDQKISYTTDEPLRQGVYKSFLSKYPEWVSPGIKNVHILAVEPAS